MIWSSPVRSLLSSWFSQIGRVAAVAAATTLWRRRRKPETHSAPAPAAPECKAAGRVIQFRTQAATISGTIGPCLSCRCDHVNVHLLTNFIRYCECPRCGSAWTEPAKVRVSDPDLPYYPSEPLKFVRDRN